MATFDLVLLSSSPPTSSGATELHTTPSSKEQRVSMSAYSPIPISPLDGGKKKSSGACTMGKRASPTPDRAITGFATAGSLLKSHHFNLDDHAYLKTIQSAQPLQSSVTANTKGNKGVKSPQKPSTKATATSNADVKPTKSRARKSEVDKVDSTHDEGDRVVTSKTLLHFANSNVGNIIDTPPEPAAPATKTQSTKPRKPRTKKEKPADGENEIANKKAKVTKSRKAIRTGGKAQRKATDAVSSHFPMNTTGEDDKCADHFQTHEIQSAPIQDMSKSPRRRTNSPPKRRPPEDHALELDMAIARRRKWTPTKNTEVQYVSIGSSSKENTPFTVQGEKGRFTSMLSGFAFANAECATTKTILAQPVESVGKMKRRRVELIDMPEKQKTSNTTSPDKSKAPKKKARTITDIVTGQYAPKTATPTPDPATSDFFIPRATIAKVPLNDASEPSSANAPLKPTRKRPSTKTSDKSDSTSRKSSSKSITAKPKMVADKLLSPASALSQVNRQEILFGTSSQLALEESPTMMLEIQTAIRRSEDATLSNLDCISRSHLMQRLEKMEGKRGLWAASARGDDGMLLDNTGDVHISEPHGTQDLALFMDRARKDGDTTFVDIDNFQRSSPQHSSPTPPLLLENQRGSGRDESVGTLPFKDIDNYHHPTVMAPQNPTNVIEQTVNDLSFEDIDSFQPPPSNQNTSLNFFDIEIFPPSTQPPPLSRSPTSKHPTPNASPPKRSSYLLKAHATDLAPPSTPPRSIIRSKFANIEEILDSEDDEALSPTPPRTSYPSNSPSLSLVPAQPTFTPAPPKTKAQGKRNDDEIDEEVIPVLQIKASQLQWVNIKESVFKRITSHIRSLSPTTNPDHPSWYEKILMYDPIVLEDFTLYLNTHTSIRTNKRATNKQIKLWNKAQKIVGGEVFEVKEGWREEVDGDDEVVYVVEKILEAWMVQAWCQELSICCVYRESRRPGGIRKGLY